MTKPTPNKSWHVREKRLALLLVMPVLILVVGFFVFPIGYSFYISFTHSDGTYFEWRGLENYLRVFRDPTFYQVLGVTLKFLMAVPLVILISIICSVLLYERIAGWKFFRIIFFLPSILSGIVIGTIFKTIFGYYGPVNQILQSVGMEPQLFFISANKSIWIIIAALVWSGFGYQTVLLLSGLNSISIEVFEAAILDGAGWWKRLWFVTVPNIRRVLGFVFIINVLYTFTSLYGFIYVLTGGGPGFDTTSLDYLVFQKAFSPSDLGGGAAISIVLFAIVGSLTVLQNKVFKITED